MLLLGSRYTVAEPDGPGCPAAAYDLVLDRDVAIVLVPGPWRGERAARRLRLTGADAPDSSGRTVLDAGVQADTLYVVLLPEPTAHVAPAAAVVVVAVGPDPPRQRLEPLEAPEPQSGVSDDDRPEFSRPRVMLTAASVFAVMAAVLAIDGLPAR